MLWQKLNKSTNMFVRIFTTIIYNNKELYIHNSKELESTEMLIGKNC